MVASTLGAFASSGCDVGAPEINAINRGFNRPTVSLVSASVTTSYDADGRPVYSNLSQGGETAVMEVPVSASIALRFDRFLLPHKVIRQSVCIRPSTEPVASIADCTQPGQPFAAVEYNPVLRTVFLRLPDGASLDADTRYRITLFATESLDESGFFAFDGAPLAQSYTFDFQTTADASTAVPEQVPGRDNYCAAIACFDACDAGDDVCRDACRPLCVEPTCANDGDLAGGSTVPVFEGCAFSGCHGPTDPFGAMPSPAGLAMGLDLLTPGGVMATALGKTANQTHTGEAATEADVSPARFGRAMPLIDPDNPGNSYVMYKVIANILNHKRLPNGRLSDPVQDVEDTRLPLEIDRLRDAVVVGMPMPVESADGEAEGFVPRLFDPSGQASFARMMLLNAWIANGAVLDCNEGG